MAWRENASSNHLGFFGFLFNALLRFAQFVLALTVLGLYGTDLNNARLAGQHADGRWVFAEVTGGLAAVTSVIFAMPFIPVVVMFPWDTLIFFFWIVVTGIFGNLYVHANPNGNSQVERMRNAVWVDIVSLILWFVTAVYGLINFFHGRKGRTLHTGRATV